MILRYGELEASGCTRIRMEIKILAGRIPAQCYPKNYPHFSHIYFPMCKAPLTSGDRCPEIVSVNHITNIDGHGFRVSPFRRIPPPHGAPKRRNPDKKRAGFQKACPQATTRCVPASTASNHTSDKENRSDTSSPSPTPSPLSACSATGPRLRHDLSPASNRSREALNAALQGSAHYKKCFRNERKKGKHSPPAYSSHRRHFWLAKPRLFLYRYASDRNANGFTITQLSTCQETRHHVKIDFSIPKKRSQ